MIAGRAPLAACACAPPSRPAARCFVCGCNTDQRVAGRPIRRPITACGIRSRCRKPTTSIELFIGSNRGELNADATRAGSLLRARLEARSDRRHRRRPAGRQPQRAAPPPMPCARSYRSSPPAACRRKASRCAPIRRRRAGCHRAHQLSEDHRAGRPLRHLAGGYRAEHDARAISRTGRTGISAAPTSAISPPWSTIRPISCSRAAKPRAYTMRRTTVIEKYRVGQTTRDAADRAPRSRPKSPTSANDGCK